MNFKFPWFKKNQSDAIEDTESHSVLSPESQKVSPAFYNSLINSLFNGDKFFGGFGETKPFEFVDYWTLRQRSVQLFTENIYARGVIKRLLTNIINKGLGLEATPVGEILNEDDEFINEWSENTETLYRLWGKNKQLVDWKRLETDGDLQETAKKTAILSGDCLVVLRISSATGLPVTELIDGRHIRNPIGADFNKSVLDRGNKIIHGVEVDQNGRHVAFFVQQRRDNLFFSGQKRKDLFSFIRIPAKGAKSGRRIAWLIYGSKRLMDDVRGMPLLGIILQSLKEIDRYRDSEQRAATVNAMLALFIQKNNNKAGTLPLGNGAVRRETVAVEQTDGSTRNLNLAKWLPGTTFDELAQGETPISFDTKRPNVNFAVFEAAILNGIAWSLEIPPEILKLAFNSNYSASRMANSEFDMFLNKERTQFANDYLIPRYQEWLVSMVLTDRIQADGFLEAWRDINQFAVFGAWSESDWSGAIKPHIDPLKEVKAKAEMIAQGLMTRDRAAKELTGMKFSRIVRQLKKENEQLAGANQILIPEQSDNSNSLNAAFIDQIDSIFQAKIEEHLEQNNIN